VTRVAIIDSGGANIASLRFALERLGVDSVLTSDSSALREASHVLLPGVGTAADCMERLRKAGLIDTIRTLTQPILGICVGMQLLFEASDEGDVDCLGLLPGRVKRFDDKPGLTIPHMGWNQLEFVERSPLLADIEPGAYVYFVHSYCVPTSDITMAWCTYGETFSAIVQRDNIYGVQFHPERSAQTGSLLLRNFLRL